MFVQDTPVPKAVAITRVKNGFMLEERDARTNGMLFDPFVFPTLRALFDFLIENDFEVVDYDTTHLS